MTKDPQDLSKGDQVSWNWGSGNPKGKVQEVVEGEATTTTKNGNEIKAKGDEENPAVVIKANSGSNAIKKVSCSCFRVIVFVLYLTFCLLSPQGKRTQWR